MKSCDLDLNYRTVSYCYATAESALPLILFVVAHSVNPFSRCEGEYHPISSPQFLRIFSSYLCSGFDSIMEKQSAPSQTQPASEEPVKSIEEDAKGEGKDEKTPATGGIPEDLWRVMMDVVLAIYEVREEE